MRLVSWCAVVTLGAVGVWLRRRFVVVTVDGQSMEPAYRAGDRVLVRRKPLRDVRRGQVVVVEQPVTFHGSTAPIGAVPVQPGVEGIVMWRSLGRRVSRRPWMIKRAVAVPGDPVPPELGHALIDVAGTPVPPDRLIVLGDNAEVSVDSRSWGFVPGDRVLGVALRRVP
jgi:signal peptidase I